MGCSDASASRRFSTLALREPTLQNCKQIKKKEETEEPRNVNNRYPQLFANGNRATSNTFPKFSPATPNRTKIETHRTLVQCSCFSNSIFRERGHIRFASVKRTLPSEWKVPDYVKIRDCFEDESSLGRPSLIFIMI